MAVESDIKSYLDNHVGLGALVGDRIYASHLPQKPTYPNIVFHIVSRVPQTIMNGAATLRRDRFSFEIRAATLSSVLAIEEQLLVALDATVRATDGFVGIHLSAVDAPYEYTVETFHRVVDYAIWYQP